MNLNFRRFALALYWLCACSGRTLVGEVRKDGGSNNVEQDRDAGMSDLLAEVRSAGGVGMPLEQGGQITIDGGSDAGTIGDAPQQSGTGGKRFATLLLQPGPGAGEDVSVVLLGDKPYPLRPQVAQLSAQTTTFDSVPVLRRSLIRFAMPRMLDAQDIVKAELLLWHDPDLVSHSVGTRWRLGRSASDWDQRNLSWLTQPQMAADAIEPPAPTSSGTDYVIDVTGLVRNALAERKQPNFLLRLADEETLGQQIIFCSSEHTDGPCRPALYVEFTLDNL